MSLFKVEQQELLKIKSILSSAGYFVCRIERNLGGSKVVIHAVGCAPGEYDTQIQEDIRLLESLPDDAAPSDYYQRRASRAR
jgi:hypothetical protein